MSDDAVVETPTEEPTDIATTEEEVVNPLAMSDEEYLASPPEIPEEPTEEPEEKPEETSDPEKPAETVTEEPTDTLEEKPEADVPIDTKAESADADIDYAAVGKEILSEFKANGRMMTVKDVDDARRLMQMGANYNEKMAGMKPALKSLRLLEKYDLLSPEKLNYLIDLHEQKPEAITKLLQDSKLDPLDIDIKTEQEYQPENRTISDKQILLEDTIESISNSPKYLDTVNTITKVWDDVSKGIIADKPELIPIINEQQESGVYDQVMDAVRYERSMGRLQGVNDVEAYVQVGAALNNQAEAQSTAPSSTPTDATPPAQVDTPETVAARNAAAPTPASAPAKKDLSGYNPLAMTDAEYKQFAKELGI